MVCSKGKSGRAASIKQLSVGEAEHLSIEGDYTSDRVSEEQLLKPRLEKYKNTNELDILIYSRNFLPTIFLQQICC